MLAAYDALNRRDVDAVFALAHEELEVDWTESMAPYAEHFRGRDRARAQMAEFFAMWDSLQWSVEEVSEPEREQVVAVTRTRARGRDGIEMDTHSAWLWSFREGSVARIKLCQTKADALATLAAERA